MVKLKSCKSSSSFLLCFTVTRTYQLRFYFLGAYFKIVIAIVIHTHLLTVEQPVLRLQRCLCSACPAEACSDASPLQTCLVLWTDLWLERTAGSEVRRYPAGMPHPFVSLLEWRKGMCQLPTTLFLGKEGIAPGKVSKEGFCSRGRAHPCDHILFSWSFASWSSFSETSQAIGLVPGLCPCRLAWGTRVFHQSEQTTELDVTTSSTGLFLQLCDSKKPKRLTEARS